MVKLYIIAVDSITDVEAVARSAECFGALGLMYLKDLQLLMTVALRVLVVPLRLPVKTST